MALVKKEREIKVQVIESEITLELNEELTAKLESAAQTEGIEPEAYIIGLLQDHFTTGTTTTTSSAKPTGTDKAPKTENFITTLKKAGDTGKIVAANVKKMVEESKEITDDYKTKIYKHLNAIIDGTKSPSGVQPTIPASIIEIAKQLLF